MKKILGYFGVLFLGIGLGIGILMIISDISENKYDIKLKFNAETKKYIKECTIKVYPNNIDQINIYNDDLKKLDYKYHQCLKNVIILLLIGVLQINVVHEIHEVTAPRRLLHVIDIMQRISVSLPLADILVVLVVGLITQHQLSFAAIVLQVKAVVEIRVRRSMTEIHASVETCHGSFGHHIDRLAVSATVAHGRQVVVFDGLAHGGQQAVSFAHEVLSAALLRGLGALFDGCLRAGCRLSFQVPAVKIVGDKSQEYDGDNEYNHSVESPFCGVSRVKPTWRRCSQ